MTQRGKLKFAANLSSMLLPCKGVMIRITRGVRQPMAPPLSKDNNKAKDK